MVSKGEELMGFLVLMVAVVDEPKAYRSAEAMDWLGKAEPLVDFDVGRGISATALPFFLSDEAHRCCKEGKVATTVAEPIAK
jgi:hypothetical protein